MTASEHARRRARARGARWRIVARAALFAMVAGTRTVAAAAAGPSDAIGCALGQYVVDGAGAIVAGAAAAAASEGPAVIEIAGAAAAIVGACEPTRVRIERRRTKIKLRARWASCGADRRRLRLRATVDATTCRAMTGVLKRSRPRRALRFSATKSLRVLAFSRTQGFRHGSIEDAKAFFGGLAATTGIVTVLSEDPAMFSEATLAGFDVVLFANTTGDVLDDAQQAALVGFVRAGRGYVGVHSAADTEHEWPWYGRLVGAYFRSHPLLPVRVTVTTEDATHPATAALPAQFEFTDEIYNFDRNPRRDHAILLTVDEAGFVFPNFPAGPSMGADHPIAWYKEFEGGRSFYTNLGHRPETWRDPLFQDHLLAGVRWAAAPAAYSRVLVTGEARNPMALAVAPDGVVFYIERTGEVRRWEPTSGRVFDALRVAVDTTAENGLLGIALDPRFAANGYVYLYHSVPVPVPAPPPGPPGENVLSRFTALADGTIDPSSRVDLLRVPSERECCHEGGSLAFAPDGTLFLSTGDNTDPFASRGAAPLDERPGRERYNSQRTAQNPFDLRGKILRINPDGGTPPGNMFPPSGEQGLPQIYAMGCRNPFRTAVDPESGRLFWGEVGPDANGDGARGPRGYDEINVASAPGNYGWPWCIGPNLPYVDWDFSTETPLASFSCTGMVPSVLAYDYATATHLALGSALYYDEVGFTGRTAIAGVFYRRPTGAAPYALPPPFTDTLLMAEWTRDLLAAVDIGPDGALRGVRRLLPWERFRRPIDMEVGPDGALYVLEYGTEFFGDNDDAALTRIEHSATGDLPPVAVLGASATAGPAPLTVEFGAEGSRAPGRGDRVKGYLWDFDGDGRVDSRQARTSHTFEEPGAYPVTLTVLGSSGRRSVPAVQDIVVGNTPPEVAIASPADGVTVPLGALVTLDAAVNDAEDGVPPCAALTWDIRLGHNAHSHPVRTYSGCTLVIPALVPREHGDSRGLFLAVELRYVDQGAPGDVPPLTGRAGIRINVALP